VLIFAHQYVERLPLALLYPAHQFEVDIPFTQGGWLHRDGAAWPWVGE
jgi:hypothetical protein